MLFYDRREAGEKLAEKVKPRLPNEKCIVYALPRGGVVCAAPIARMLQAPLDLIFTRKIGHPNNPEYAIGAIAEEGEPLLSEAAGYLPATWISSTIQAERGEIQRRRREYLQGRAPLMAHDKTAVIVDDGLATGFTMQAAILYAKEFLYPKRLIVALPVAPEEELVKIEQMVDEVIVLHREQGFFGGVGRYYVLFPQVTDEEVKALLTQFTERR